MTTDLQAILDGLPTGPGVYLMKDGRGRVLYVGKARNLRARARQYFADSSSDTRPMVGEIRRRTEDVEVILTRTEKEALLLEFNLVQRFDPPCNIRLRDDKSFLCLRLDPRRPWPRLEMVRRPRSDGALVFGPYHSATAARETQRLVGRHFKLRTCSDRAFKNRVRPCLQHQIKRCMAPCVLDVDAGTYARQVEFVRLFLEGRRDDLIVEIERRMEEAAAALEYENAAMYRDQIAAVRETLAPQRITEIADRDQDVLGLAREGDAVLVTALEVRGGRLAGRRDFDFTGLEAEDAEILVSFVLQRYTDPKRVPDEVLLSRPVPETRELAEILTERRGRKVVVRHPRRGARRDQISLAELNAGQAFERRFREAAAVTSRLEAVQRRLHLPHPPRRIECVDIAHLGGRDAVGAIAVVEEGRVRRPRGRRYKIRAATGGDDYAAIAEVLTRRFRRAAAGEAGWDPPDLLVVDGGRGQLARARAALEELGFDEQPVVALAKERSGDAGAVAVADRVYLPGRKNPIPLRAETSPLHLLAAARDEAHRLANRFQGKVRRRRALRPALADVPGVGPKLLAALIERFGSARKASAASADELAAVPGVGPALAARIREHLSRG